MIPNKTVHFLGWKYKDASPAGMWINKAPKKQHAFKRSLVNSACMRSKLSFQKESVLLFVKTPMVIFALSALGHALLTLGNCGSGTGKWSRLSDVTPLSS